MKLTGNALIAFEKWYRNPHGADENRWTNWHQYGGLDIYNIDFFNLLPPEMQYGVYVDFFDENDIQITDGKFGFRIVTSDETINKGFMVRSRQESRTKALQKANELFNNLEQ